MERDCIVTIHWFDQLESTQLFAKEAIKNEVYPVPFAIATRHQTHGIGSRGNRWIGHEGNLFFSFVIVKSELPDDLKLESASIYFMYLLKDEFKRQGIDLWLKWPNDLYSELKKVGGCITNIQGENLICGIGINIQEAPEDFGKIDISVDTKQLLKTYFKSIEKKIPWKQVFSKYQLEFENNKRRIPYTSHNVISLADATMMKDGSLMCDGIRIYSQR
jgi:BirA family transcriptional regulator, biotin operon repressor / biotin---[acetyl-CoA-carboxylase] ligase